MLDGKTVRAEKGGGGWTCLLRCVQAQSKLSVGRDMANVEDG